MHELLSKGQTVRSPHFFRTQEGYKSDPTFFLSAFFFKPSQKITYINLSPGFSLKILVGIVEIEFSLSILKMGYHIGYLLLVLLMEVPLIVQ